MAKTKKSVNGDAREEERTTLKGIKETTMMTLYDYDGPFDSDEHPEWGESYLLKLMNNGEKVAMFLNQKSVAGKTFFKAVDSGKLSAVDMGGTQQLIFKPKNTGNPPPADTMVQLRFGKAFNKQEIEDSGEEAPF